jgi:rare lipoprotein A
LGSWVEVIFPKTNKSIIVRVNDRGPFRKGAIIDLSMIAAQQIGLIPYGISKVSIRLIPTIEITDSLRFTWLARDSINLKLHPRSTQKLKHKKKRSKNKIRVK